MKPYRVTLKYIIKDHILTLSIVIPAYNENTAIKSCVEANRITGVVEKKAEEICL
jgi:hypothetical protein